MADRLTEKKENQSDDDRIPVVTPDRNNEARQQHRNRNEFKFSRKTARLILLAVSSRM